MSGESPVRDPETILKSLVMRAREGDQAAYRELLTTLAPIIRRMLAAHAGQRRSLVEDIAQDALLAIHLKLHTYDPALPFLAWVNAVARHKLIDGLRRVRGIDVSIDDESFPELADEAAPDAASAGRDLDRLLGQLTPPAGAIIRALKVEGVSVRELAALHRLSEANVKVIVHRGLQKLARLVRTL